MLDRPRRTTSLAALFGMMLTLLLLAPAHAADSREADSLRYFESQIRPILVEHCVKCHGPDKQKGGLRLDSGAAVRTGGDSGPAVVPGKPEESLLIDAVAYEGLEMPPDGQLPEAQRAALKKWVELGAPWPNGPAATPVARPKITDADRAWWAFQPVKRAHPPLAGQGWARNPIDRFVAQRLEAEKLTPAPEASRATLVRRLTFDLIGLPPNPAEMAAALADPRVDWYERLVDRLLASPQYGVKWARHWLDLVRYADSDGYRADHERPDAWRYRDYVVNALNEDRPYDRFVREQLAGDELDPTNPEALVATGYLRHGIYEYNNRDVRGQWTVILNDLTDTTADVFLGLGLQCARCHDHKFDPLLQKDYFRLQAFFAPIQLRDATPVAREEEQRTYEARLAAWEKATAGIRAQIEAIEAPHRVEAARSAIRKLPEDIRPLFDRPIDQLTPLERQLVELGARQVDYEYSRLDTFMKGAEKEKYLALRKALASHDPIKPKPLPTALTAGDIGREAPPVTIPRKGSTPIEPGWPTIFDEAPAPLPEPSPTAHTTGRRTVLANWITRPDNPLTTRVIVNRVWQYHFGRGLAANSSDFGKLGEPPTHPELLDWLTATFVRDGWRLKDLHRLIVTSATYRQSTAHPNAVAYRKVDPLNRFYWRSDTRRLDAEFIRDAILAVSGQLDLKRGGPAVASNQPRRTIDTKSLRNTRDPLLDVFDLPIAFTSIPSRDATTTPLQSLLLLNAPMMIEHARAFADRLAHEAGDEPARQVGRAYQLAYNRDPTPEERAEALRFLADQSHRVGTRPGDVAEGQFLSDKIPTRGGQAARFELDGPQSRLVVSGSPDLGSSDFTIECFFVLRSVDQGAGVRTLAARWNGQATTPGWSFGVTGKGSRRKPQTLVLQIYGTRAGETKGPVEAAIFSDQHISLDKPYFAAASVRLATPDRPGAVTFSLKDLANSDEPILTSQVPLNIVGGFSNDLPLTLGGRSGKGAASFDGLI
ncbi:MAG: PSD1 and planctomycete cytochrome C domain-containing protein, partial [Isosphaeraceae bacterium]